MTNIAIIGTAGRGADIKHLTKEVWKLMVNDATARIHLLSPGYPDITLVSGGAAWADHLAVRLFLDGTVTKLRLHLPANLNGGQFGEVSSENIYDPGRIANHYHKQFGCALGTNTVLEVWEAHERGAEIIVTPGFKPRNKKVAAETDLMIAYTFGYSATPYHGQPGGMGYIEPLIAGLKDGGTADTWHRATRADHKWHVPIHWLINHEKIQDDSGLDDHFKGQK